MREKFRTTKSEKLLFLVTALFLCALAALFWSDRFGRESAAYTITTGEVATQPIVPLPLLVNINSASVEELTELTGVGEVLAGRIIAWREEHGRFEKIEEIQQVSGIGPGIYADIQEEITIG